jgi:copper(I)-binding protein
MRRRFLCTGALSLFLAAMVLPVTTVAAASTGGVVFRDVTVTAAKAGGDSAVIMTITNDTKGPISLTTVTSAVSRMSMIYYDDNMCQGNHAMSWLANIFIEPRHTQVLALKYQGAMLGNLRGALVKGSTVPIEVKWSNFSSAHVLTVNAKVIAPPKGLHFLMSSMNMKM